MQIQQPDYAAWQSITNGTPCSRVIELLGEPRSIHDGGIFKLWHYGTIHARSKTVPEDLQFTLFIAGDTALQRGDPFDGVLSSSGLPVPPQLVFPYNGMVLSHHPNYLDFRWRPSSGTYPIKYHIVVTPGVNVKTDGIFYSFKPAMNVSGTQQFAWRVRAINELGCSAWSEERTFTFTAPKKANKILHRTN